jgi:hypothetical protein
LILWISAPQAASFESKSLSEEGRDVDAGGEFCAAERAKIDDVSITGCCVEVLLEIGCANEVNYEVDADVVCGF